MLLEREWVDELCQNEMSAVRELVSDGHAHMH